MSLMMQPDVAATKIQAAFRGYSTRKQLAQEQEAAVKIQSAYRGYSTRKQLKEQEQAAVKIQSAFRRYSTKKTMDQVKDEFNQLSSTIDQPKESADLLNAKKEYLTSQLQFVEQKYMNKLQETTKA
jgi:myosin heavy subunit